MLQRIQTFYLFLSALCSGVLYFILPLSIIESKPYFAQERPEFLALFIASTLLAVVAIFKFKSRQTQFVLGRLNILLNLILLGLFCTICIVIFFESKETVLDFSPSINLLTLYLLINFPIKRP